VRIAGAGHNPHRDDPEAVWQALAGWLAARLPEWRPRYRHCRQRGQDQVWLIMWSPNACSKCSLSRVKPAAL